MKINAADCKKGQWYEYNEYLLYCLGISDYKHLHSNHFICIAKSTGKASIDWFSELCTFETIEDDMVFEIPKTKVEPPFKSGTKVYITSFENFVPRMEYLKYIDSFEIGIDLEFDVSRNGYRTTGRSTFNLPAGDHYWIIRSDCLEEVKD